MKNINKIMMFIMMLFICNVTCIVSAEELPFGMISQEVDPNDISTQVPLAPRVTIEDANKFVVEKGTKIILFIQSIAKPVTLVVMVICGLMAVLAGLTGGKDGASSRWALSALISAICYIGIMGAPVILEFLKSFMME